MTDTTKETSELIFRDFELISPQNQMTEAEIIAYLADAIAYMIEHKLDFLLSLLYRLDVEEAKINRALLPNGNESANVALAKLVWERQKKRIETKMRYQQPRNIDWDIDF